jgi:hypothetical protein
MSEQARTPPESGEHSIRIGGCTADVRRHASGRGAPRGAACGTHLEPELELVAGQAKLVVGGTEAAGPQALALHYLFRAILLARAGLGLGSGLGFGSGPGLGLGLEACRAPSTGPLQLPWLRPRP